MNERILRNPKNGQDLVTTATDAEVMHHLQHATSDFAKSLWLAARKQKKGLTMAQFWWAHKLYLDATNPKPKREIAVGNFENIAKLFEHAKEHLKHPKIAFILPGLGTVKLSVAGPRAKVPGSINVTDDGKYPDNVWYGRILENGHFEAGHKSTPEIENALQEFAADPAGYAGKYGQLTGACAFCGLPLKDERSTEVGYGPVCAKHYGLPWGAKPQVDALALAEHREAQLAGWAG